GRSPRATIWVSVWLPIQWPAPCASRINAAAEGFSSLPPITKNVARMPARSRTCSTRSVTPGVGPLSQVRVTRCIEDLSCRDPAPLHAEADLAESITWMQDIIFIRRPPRLAWVRSRALRVQPRAAPGRKQNERVHARHHHRRGARADGPDAGPAAQGDHGCRREAPPRLRAGG